MKGCKNKRYFMSTTKPCISSLLSNQTSVLTGEQAEIPSSQAEDCDLNLTSEIFISTFFGKLLPVSCLWTQSCVDEDWSSISYLENTQRETRRKTDNPPRYSLLWSWASPYLRQLKYHFVTEFFDPFITPKSAWPRETHTTTCWHNTEIKWIWHVCW